MWELDQPNYFYLLIIVPILVLALVANLRWKKNIVQAFGSGSFLKRLAPEASSGKPILKAILALVAIFFIVIALVNPKIGTKIETVKRQGVDIVFTVDVSKSMLAEDIAPNRLEKSKQLMTQIINNLGSDRVGLVAYAGSAFPLMPISSDYNLAKMYAKDLDTDLVSSMGTALSEAIQVSANYFENVDSSKVIILLSDGEDHSEGISDAINIAKDKGISIISIGVGTEDGGKIPIKINGKLQEYKKDGEGNEVVTKMNDATLKEMASATNGTFMYGSNTEEVVDLVNKALQKIEKKDFESQQIADFDSQFQWFLALALLVLCIDAFVLNRKTSWMKKWNLFNEK